MATAQGPKLWGLHPLSKHGFKPCTGREILLTDSGSIPCLITPKGVVAILE